MTKQIQRGFLAAASFVAAGAANAATDVTAVTATNAEIAAVGAAVFGVMVAIKLTKWIRRAL